MAAGRESVHVGTVSCPSGMLLVGDPGAWPLWPFPIEAQVRPGGDDPDSFDAVDLVVTGPDAARAAAKVEPHGALWDFNRQPGIWLYDVERENVGPLREAFAAFCTRNGFRAAVEAEPERVPLPERARRCVGKRGYGTFLIRESYGSHPVVVVAGLPTDRPLTVDAFPGLHGPLGRVVINSGAGAEGHPLEMGYVPVDGAGVIAGDPNAIAAFDPARSVDGLVDIGIYGSGLTGPECPAPVLDNATPGFKDLPESQVEERLGALRRWVDATPEASISSIQLMPHSPMWRLNRAVDESPVGVGTVETDHGGVLLFNTGGDGTFEVWGRRRFAERTTGQISIAVE